MEVPDRPTCVRMFNIMATIKCCDERFRALLTSGVIRIAGYYSPRGQEAISAGVGTALERDDYVVSYYRGLHDHIAKGIPLGDLWAECLGRAAGTCKGKGGPMHVTYPPTGMLVTTGIVGSGIPIANGLAWASQLRGDGRVTACNFGDGASNTGAFHEALNLAGLWGLPVIFICQNNLIAEHTHFRNGTAVESVADRASSYNMHGESIDGNDPLIVWSTVRDAIARARRGDGPTLIEALTFRFHGHNFGDPATEIPRSMMDAAREKDPYPRYRAWLTEAGHATEAELDQIETAVSDEVRIAEEYAMSTPEPQLDDLHTDVFAGLS